MTNELILYIISFLGGIIIGCNLMAFYFSRKRFIIRIDKERNEATIYQESAKPGKLKFIPDATAQELEEMEKPKMKKFLGTFNKPAPKEDDDEI